MNFFPVSPGSKQLAGDAPGWDDGGEVWQACGGGVSIFAGYWHGPTARARGIVLQPQHRHAEWSVDIEGSSAFMFGNTDLHLERAFKTEKQAREWFDYATWCLSTLTVEQVRELCAQTKGRLT